MAKKKATPKAKMAPMKGPGAAPFPPQMGQPQPFAKGGKFKAGSKPKKK